MGDRYEYGGVADNLRCDFHNNGSTERLAAMTRAQDWNKFVASDEQCATAEKWFQGRGLLGGGFVAWDIAMRVAATYAEYVAAARCAQVEAELVKSKQRCGVCDDPDCTTPTDNPQAHCPPNCRCMTKEHSEFRHHPACNTIRNQPIGTPGCICVITYKKRMAELVAAESEVTKLREALTKIANPFEWLRTHVEEGMEFNGAGAAMLAKDANWLSEIAQKANSREGDNGPK